MNNVLNYLEQVCRDYPDKIAVAMRDDRLTFSQMRTAARRLARTFGDVGQNRPIGVFANRSVEPAVWYLAVLYSGNFYVPLDPDMPIEKMQAVVDDAQMPVVIGNADNKETADRLNRSFRFVTDADMAEEQAGFPTVGDDDPSYMVYTSGSTGKPKGVLKSHGAICSYVEAFCATFPFTSDEVIGNQTPFFFDASAKDFYLMLKTGATLEIIPTEKFSLPTELMEYMNERRVSFVSWVPTALSIVAQLNPFSLVKPMWLRRVFFVGEVMPTKHLNKWREALPDVQYVNLYGQSELAGICCWYEVTKTFDNSAVLPLGKPLCNCRIYLTDGDKTVTAAGQVGEMYIASPALALEYFNDAEKTRASFTVKDFGNGPERCFKTGDLAQYDTEGNLVFAARSDFQIKHMGHRIELGEIEAVAGALPEIGRCCCLYNAERRKIVLFVQLTEPDSVTGREIQSALRQRLSSYMVPGRVVVLESLPLNANGKIDRQKLKLLL